MQIKLLHIDDDANVLERVKRFLEAREVAGHSLTVVDSVGFEEGLTLLTQKAYDAVILDLCVGDAAELSDKVGEDIFKSIQQKAFIPVVFFTGLPGHVAHLTSSIVKVTDKAEGLDTLKDNIQLILESGFLKIKSDVLGMVNEGVRSFFWDFVHQKSEVVAELTGDDVSLKYLLLRRLAKSLTADFLKSSIDEPMFKKDHAHPMEFYIYPPLEGEYQAGDIVKRKDDNQHFIALTPSCDFVVRPDGTRSAEKITLVQLAKFKESAEFIKMKAMETAHYEKQAQGEAVTVREADQLRSLKDKIRTMMRPNWKDRYFFLPPTPFIEASFIDFQQKNIVTYDQLKDDFERVALLDDPIGQAAQSSYARYHSRVGYPDLDVDYTFSKFK